MEAFEAHSSDFVANPDPVFKIKINQLNVANLYNVMNKLVMQILKIIMLLYLKFQLSTLCELEGTL